MFNRLMNKWLQVPDDSSWAVDLEWARIRQQPVRARALLWLMLLAVIALLAWAAVVELDEVAHAEGKVIPSSQLQILQSLDGGVVDAIYVAEGELVDVGQPLLKVNSVRFQSDLRERNSQSQSLAAEIARLEALTNDTELAFPPNLQKAAPRLLANERALFDSSRSQLAQQLAGFEQQVLQREEDLREDRANLAQYSRVQSLAMKELRKTKPLLASGAVSEIDIIKLERDLANARGQVARARAGIARSKAAIEESQNKISEARLKMNNRWREQLSQAVARFNALEKAQVGLADKVTRTVLKAPVRGTVQRLFANTLGGVVRPGQDVVEIVPADDQLLVEARISPRDIGFIRPGQHAMVKFSAFDFAIFGGLKASVSHISADTITNERDETFYLARLKTDATGFSEEMTIIPGMTAQVDIMTGKKTILTYLLKPVLRATSEALSER